MAFIKLALSGNRNMYRYPRPNQVHMNPRNSLLVNHGCGRGFASFKFSGQIERLPISLRLCPVGEALSGGNLRARLPRKAAELQQAGVACPAVTGISIIVVV